MGASRVGGIVYAGTWQPKMDIGSGVGFQNTCQGPRTCGWTDPNIPHGNMSDEIQSHDDRPVGVHNSI